jgi:hypothetical protein
MAKHIADRQEGVSEAIRGEIAKIPASELQYARPSRVLPGLEAAGFKITPAVRSTTSKLLKTAKKNASAIISVADAIAESGLSNDRRELAMKLI